MSALTRKQLISVARAQLNTQVCDPREHVIVLAQIVLPQNKGGVKSHTEHRENKFHSASECAQIQLFSFGRKMTNAHIFVERGEGLRHISSGDW